MKRPVRQRWQLRMPCCFAWRLLSLGWQIHIADVTAAFLQGLALPRSEPLYIRAPSGCPQEVLDYLRRRLGLRIEVTFSKQPRVFSV